MWFFLEGGTDGKDEIGPGSALPGVDQDHVGSAVMEIDQDPAANEIPVKLGCGMQGSYEVAVLGHVHVIKLFFGCHSSIVIDRFSTAARQTSSQALTERRALSPVTGGSLPFVIASCSSS